MPERMWANTLFNPSCLCKILNNKKNHHPGNWAAPSVEEYIILLARLYPNVDTDLFQEYFQEFDCFRANGHQSLFIPLAKDLYKFNV